MTTLKTVVQPFGDLGTCPKCGHGDPFIGKAENAGTVPTFPSSDMPFAVIASMPSVLRRRYCPGGQEPETPATAESDVPKILSAFVGSVLPMLTAMNGAKPNLNICAGVLEEHLHVTCSNCGFEFLMATKDAVPVEVQA